MWFLGIVSIIITVEEVTLDKSQLDELSGTSFEATDKIIFFLLLQSFLGL